MGEMILNFFTVLGAITFFSAVLTILWIAFVDFKGDKDE